jgi:two-component system OmpR family sensor kinase
MNQKLARVQKTFIISIVGLVIVALSSLVGTLLATNIARYDQQVSAGDIDALTRSYPEVAQYIASQKPAEPHFVTIATLVKQSQERTLLQIVLLAALPITVTSALIGVVISRRLLKPVSESYEAQERFIQDAAHELRNPLAAMSATLETAKLPSKHSDKVLATTLERLERQTNRLIQINEDLLFLQRTQNAHDIRPLHLAEELEKLSEEYYAKANDKNITLALHCDDTAMIKIAPKDLEIIIRNLLDNAIKYTPAGGKVKLNIKKQHDKCVISVEDTGIGIPESDIKHITKRFYRGKNTANTPGSGLGLALVQKVADAYQAEIAIKSIVKKGTKVTVKF